jgi:hypothetical protein
MCRTHGLYLATSLAIVSPLLRTKMSDALKILAVRTAYDAKISSRLIGIVAALLINYRRLHCDPHMALPLSTRWTFSAHKRLMA